MEFKDVRYPYVTNTRNIALPVGDYGCQYEDGWVAPVVFERKSVPDLFGTLGKGHKRFQREINRAKDSKTKMILIVEGTLSKVLKGYDRSSIKGISAVKTLFTLWIKYGVYSAWCKDRVEMTDYIYHYFTSIGRLKYKPTRP